MARLTDEEREEYKRRLEEDAAADDDDEQVTVSIGDRSFTGTLRRAQEFAAAHGFSLKPAPPADDDGKGKTGTKGKTGSNVARFSGRRVS